MLDAAQTRGYQTISVQWVDAASGKTLPSSDPSTGEARGPEKIRRCDKTDVHPGRLALAGFRERPLPQATTDRPRQARCAAAPTHQSPPTPLARSKCVTTKLISYDGAQTSNMP